MRDLTPQMPTGSMVRIWQVGGHWVVECGLYCVSVGPVVDLVETSSGEVAVVPDAWSVREMRTKDVTPQELAVYQDEGGGEGSALVHAVKEVLRAASPRK